MENQFDIYLDTPVKLLLERGMIDRLVLRACQAARPPMETAGDILDHYEENKTFSDVPGCRRPGRIPEALVDIARMVQRRETPSQLKKYESRRRQAGQLNNEANFDFLSEGRRAEILMYREKFGYLPMFRILSYYLNREDAQRNDRVMAHYLGMADNEPCASLADIGVKVGLSRERIRQILQTWTLPEQLSHARLWKQYADHSTYFANHSSEAYEKVVQTELPELSFGAYASILHHTTMLQNVEGRFLARRGWVEEISAWHDRLMRLAGMPRAISSRISLEGLAMGGSLDTRISLIVLNQIAPALGLLPDAPDAIILPVQSE